MSRLTPFGVLEKYLTDEAEIAWAAYHSDRIIEKLEAEGYKITDLRKEGL